MNYQRDAEELLNTVLKEKFFFPTEQTNQMLKGEKAILVFLFSQNEKILAGKLSEELKVSTARIAFILNNLESKKLITRDIDKEDKRKVWVSITESGSKEISLMKEEMVGCLAAVIKELGIDKLKEHVELMKKIKEIMEKENSKRRKE